LVVDRAKNRGKNNISTAQFALSEKINWLRAPNSARNWMINRPILYIIRSLPEKEILYVGETNSMHRRLYKKRNEHFAMAFYQDCNRHYEVIYDQWLLGEQERIKKEILLTAQLKPHWIFGGGDHWATRKKWSKGFEKQRYKPYFGMHHLPIKQFNLLTMAA